MTDDEKSFWDHLLANPDDDTTRLVYADWLDEHDESAKAKYLRLTVAIASTGEDEDIYEPMLSFWELWYDLDPDWRRCAASPRVIELIDSVGLGDEEEPATAPTEQTVVIDPHRDSAADMLRSMLARLPMGQPLVIVHPPEEFQKTPFGLRLTPKLNRKARRARRKK